MTMRLAVGLGLFGRKPEVDEDERLRLAAQIGVEGVRLGSPNLPGDKRWEYQDLIDLRKRIESFGLRLEGIENVPMWFTDKAMLGLPGTDEQIENYQHTIRNIGRAGIPILGYHWMPQHVWRTKPNGTTRSGAEVDVFDLARAKDVPIDADRIVLWGGVYTDRLMETAKGSILTHGRVYTEEERWASFEYFMRAVMPVAEEAGVKLALHPDDPPVPSLGGIARPFRSFEAFKRAMEIANSDNWGLNFCLGTWSEMPSGVDGILRAIEFFGPRKRIFYAHFRDVQGHVPRFQEAFLGEGNYNPVSILLALKRAGFDGFFLEDHVPHLVGDNGWEARARLYQQGYIKGLLDAVQALG